MSYYSDKSDEQIKAENLVTELFQEIANAVGTEEAHKIAAETRNYIENNVDMGENPGINFMNTYRYGDEAIESAKNDIENMLNELETTYSSYGGNHTADEIAKAKMDLSDDIYGFEETASLFKIG